MPYNPELNKTTNKTYDLKYQIEILNKIVNLEKNEPIILSEAEKLSLYDLLNQTCKQMNDTQRNLNIKTKDKKNVE